MVISKKAPICPICGYKIDEVHDEQWKLPYSMRKRGDNFMGWDWENHRCPKFLLEISKIKQGLIIGIWNIKYKIISK